ncbi:1192_t:CDS:2, partial [Funneliformis caledonium]
TRHNALKALPEKSKAIKTNNQYEFNIQRYAIDAFGLEILGHLIREIKALFARELISPEISEDKAESEGSQIANNKQSTSEEIYYVPFIPWHNDE